MRRTDIFCGLVNMYQLSLFVLLVFSHQPFCRRHHTYPMAFDSHLLLIVHVDKQQIIAVELLGCLHKCIELTLPGLVTADIVGNLYQLLYRSIFDDHEVHFPLSVTVIKDVFVLWAVTPQQFYIYHILQSPAKICRSDDIISVSHESRIDNVDFLV